MKTKHKRMDLLIPEVLGAKKISQNLDQNFTSDDPNSRFDWWPDLSDLDRLNIQNAPLQDRQDYLLTKVSMSIEHTMQSIAERKKFPLLDDFSILENPTPQFSTPTYSCF